MNNNLFDQALDKGARAQRLEPNEAMALAQAITPQRLHALGRAALANRTARFDDRATFVFNLQINPANICGAGCTFCNYAASKHDPHAYVLSEDEILEQVENLQPTETHIVGGLNQVWPYERNLKLVELLRHAYPDLHIKAFTAVEIAYFAKTTRKSETRILEELIAAGVNALPGGGAEIFSERRIVSIGRIRSAPSSGGAFIRRPIGWESTPTPPCCSVLATPGGKGSSIC
jgi:aminodeoxyfutalosine synthase